MAEDNKYIYGLGRRKCAIAQVRVFPKGKGAFTINGREMKDYLPVFTWQERVNLALDKAGLKDVADVSVRVLGGGVRAQADAISLGIARALLKMDADLRATLKPEGLLSRDARVKERKKFGLKKARKAPQWSKR
ncbi:TPA: 30S ribosomal protein S9 [Candidatus Uhrbacteria bacterium]|nr:30S ribosomal protein S9 [Candidatus Uhrbacteria bacterium]